MIATLLLLQSLATPSVAKSVWLPMTDWGCRMVSRDGSSFTLLGEIARKTDAAAANELEREQSALIILSDTSDRFVGKGARGLQLREPRPGEYWATLDAEHSFFITLPTQGASKAVLSKRAEVIIASGPCEARPTRASGPTK